MNDLTSLLYTAASNGEVATVCDLLKRGAKADCYCTTNGVSPLARAVENGHVKVVDVLAKHGASVHRSTYPTTDRRVPLAIASRQGDVEMVKTLINHQASVNGNTGAPDSPLACAIAHKQDLVVKLLLEHQANVNHRNYGYPPLCTADTASTEVFRMLLEHKADPDSRDPSGQTCMVSLICCNMVDKAKLLLEYRADVDSAAYAVNADTYLGLAIYYKRYEIAQLLVDYGASKKQAREDVSANHMTAWPRNVEKVLKILRTSLSICTLIVYLMHLYRVPLGSKPTPRCATGDATGDRDRDGHAPDGAGVCVAHDAKRAVVCYFRVAINCMFYCCYI